WPGNLFFSPYSVSTALAMTRAGARGRTAEQMDKVLHFALPPQRLHPAFAGLIRQVNAEKRCELSTANALWGKRTGGFDPDFLGTVRDEYGGNLETVDFARAPAEALRAINAWVEMQTRGKIRNLLGSDSVDESTRLVLTNATYFKGQWARAFTEADT